MRIKKIKWESYFPAWTISTCAVTGLSFSISVFLLFEPQSVSVQRAQQVAALVLAVGFIAFWWTKMISNLLKTLAEERRERREAPARAQQLRAAEEALARYARGEHLPQGLCGDRADHLAHEHHSASLGVFWCSADQSKRWPPYVPKKPPQEVS